MGESQNCSLCPECYGLSVMNSTDKILVNLCDIFLITTLIMAVHFMNSLVLRERLSTILEKIPKSSVLLVIALSVSILTLPVIIVLVMIAVIYKVLCSIAIKRKDKRFVQFLDSFDLFWYLEDNKTTNVHGVIESSTAELALDKIKEKLIQMFINNSMDKMFYRRNEEYGFYYWRRYSCLDLNKYVQIAQGPHDVNLNKEMLENFDENIIINNKDEGLFKVLIIKNTDDDDKGTTYNIVLKFHKSVRDDALIEFVARLVEKGDDCTISLNDSTEIKDYDSPEAIINMIAKLFTVLSNDLGEELEKRDLQERYFRMKINWTKSDENLMDMINEAKDKVWLSKLFEQAENQKIMN